MNAFIKVLMVVSLLFQPLFPGSNSSRIYTGIKHFEIEGGRKGLSLTINSLKGEFTIDSSVSYGEISYTIKEGNDLYVDFSGFTADTISTCLREDILYFEVNGSGTFDILDYGKRSLFKGRGDFSISGGLRNVIVSQDDGKISITRK